MESRNKLIIKHFAVFGDSLSDTGSANTTEVVGPLTLGQLAGLKKKSPLGAFTNGLPWLAIFFNRLANRLLITKEEKEIHELKTKKLIDKKALAAKSADDVDDVLAHKNIAGKKEMPKSMHDKLEEAINISDEVIVKNKHLEKEEAQSTYMAPEDFYALDRDTICNMAQGGSTSANYKHKFTPNLILEFTRKFVSNLDEQRKRFLAQDKARELNPQDIQQNLNFNKTLTTLSRTHLEKIKKHQQFHRDRKKETLIIEWTGANDLLTVNSTPTEEIVRTAVAARIANAKKLIEAGYQQFVLFNLPDLSLTPRYQNKTLAQREEMTRLCQLFNEELEKQSVELQDEMNAKQVVNENKCRIQIFDIASEMQEIYKKCQKGALPQFKPALLNKPFVDSKDFPKNFDHTKKTCPAPGYLFWDDVHLSTEADQLIANAFEEKVLSKFKFKSPPVEPAEDLCLLFNSRYQAKVLQDFNGIFGLWRQSNLSQLYVTNKETAEKNLIEIIRHATLEKGKRTREILIELGWMNKQGVINAKIPAIHKAYQALKVEEKEKNTKKLKNA